MTCAAPSTRSKFLVIIRPEFVEICGGNARMAAVLNHLFFRIAGKARGYSKEDIQNGEVLWYGSNKQIAEEMSKAWGESKIGDDTNEIVGMGLIGRTCNPNMRVDRTKHFFFGKDQCQKLAELCQEHGICLPHLDLPAEIRHMINQANGKSIKCLCVQAFGKSTVCNQSNYQMQTVNLPNANGKSTNSITKKDSKKTTKIDNKEGDVCTALATSRAPEQSFAIAQHTHTSDPNDISSVSDSQPKEAKAAAAPPPSHGEISTVPKVEAVQPPSSSPPSREKKKPERQEKPPANGETGNNSIALTEDERRMYGLWCGVVGYEVCITQTLKKRCEEIAPYIQSPEQFKREYEQLRRKWNFPDSIKLGNLLDHLKGKQARDQTQHRTPESVQRAATHNKSQIERMKLMIEKRKNGEKDQCAAI